MAEQIRKLSEETQTSSGSIKDALSKLEQTSERMTKSITETLKLIAANLENVNLVNESVNAITDDSIHLGDNIKVVNNAMGEVEESNKNMVDNMNQVSEVVTTMTENIAMTDDTVKIMRSKYDETASNIMLIEDTVGNLIEDLGMGGFMGTDDLKKGMYLSIYRDGEIPAKEYKGIISLIDSEGCIKLDKLNADGVEFSYERKAKYTMQVIVNNSVYGWDDIKLVFKNGSYYITVNGNPRVVNRRKYPRMPLTVPCEIKYSHVNNLAQGSMVNISANGYAIMTKDMDMVKAKDSLITIKVKEFELLENTPLTGYVIRITNNEGTYIVGCRMLEDNNDIKEYVKKRYKA